MVREDHLELAVFDRALKMDGRAPDLIRIDLPDSGTQLLILLFGVFEVQSVELLDEFGEPLDRVEGDLLVFLEVVDGSSAPVDLLCRTFCGLHTSTEGGL